MNAVDAESSYRGNACDADLVETAGGSVRLELSDVDDECVGRLEAVDEEMQYRCYVCGVEDKLEEVRGEEDE